MKQYCNIYIASQNNIFAFSLGIKFSHKSRANECIAGFTIPEIHLVRCNYPVLSHVC